MRAVVVANGKLTDFEAARRVIQPGDLLIAADGGANHCQAMGLTPAVVIGDFDSVDPKTLKALKNAGTKVISHPARKDETDLELALLHARAVGAAEVLVLAGLGARWDQTLANLLLPLHPKLLGMSISFQDGLQRIYLVEDQIQLQGVPGDLVSLIPISGDAQGVTTSGLEYPLQDESLYLGATRGVSNRLLAEEATVQVKRGRLICIHISHPSS